MTLLLNHALAVAGRLPPAAQDDIARVILQLAGIDAVESVQLTDEETRAIAVSKKAAERGEFATDRQIQAVWAKHGL